LHAAEEELVGRAVITTDGKAGTIDHIFLNEVHGLRVYQWTRRPVTDFDREAAYRELIGRANTETPRLAGGGNSRNRWSPPAIA
jgi:hypothetical protein